MKSKLLQSLAIVLIIETGLVHYFTAQHHFEEAAFLGYLFVGNFLGALVAAYGIFRKQLLGWGMGFIIAAGSITGYVWSRITGLPGLEIEAWLTPLGLVSLAVEGLFILLFFLRPWRMVAESEGSTHKISSLHYSLPIAGMITLVLLNSLAYQWEAIVSDLHHEHIPSLDEITRTPLIPSRELEQQYGMRVAQVAISALDSIVDIRLQIFDPEKAHRLLESHAALLVEQQSVIFAPHMHSPSKLKPNQIYLMFFPTQRNTIHTGSQVSLVFGDLRLEPVIVK